MRRDRRDQAVLRAEPRSAATRSAGKLLCANSIITVDGESAEALSDVVSLVSDTPDGIWRIDRLVKWRDRFVRRQGTWLYLDKRVLPDLYA